MTVQAFLQKTSQAGQVDRNGFGPNDPGVRMYDISPESQHQSDVAADQKSAATWARDLGGKGLAGTALGMGGAGALMLALRRIVRRR